MTLRTMFLASLALASAQAPAQHGAAPTVIQQVTTVPPPARPAIPVGECGKAVWPREALRYELVGAATIKFKLLPDGRVSQARVGKSSGWALLDDATIAFAQGCKYSPQQAAEAEGRELALQFAWTLDGNPVQHANMLPATCGPAGRIDGFQPFDHQASDAKGVKVRFLIDKAGAPRGVRVEGRDVDPALADEVIAYLGQCRFEFDPQGKGERTDTMVGRVLLR